ncbi:10653_t:CDS:2, partial [Acaulospora colombiana]
GPPTPPYRNSMRPISMVYGADSSSSLSKLSHPSTSGHSTPTNPNMAFDESGRFSPLPLPQERGSVYGNGSMSRRGPAGPSYLDRVEIVLPHPLAAEQQRPMSAMASPNRYSMYNVPPSPDMRRMNMPARPVSMMVPPSADIRNTGRVTNDDVQTTSSCTAHGNRDDNPPPLPPKGRPDRAQQMPPLATSASGAPQLPDMFASTSPRERSTSPPEPLLSSTAFVGSSTNGSVPNTEESVEHSASLPKGVGKETKVKTS